MKPAKIDVNHLLDKTRRPYTENNKITITIGYYDSLKKNKKKTCRDNISIIDPKTGSNQFDNLREAIVNLNQLIEKKDIKLITVLNIVFGPGITWVNPKEKRTYNKQFGDKYFSEPLVLPIGRRKTIIVRLTMGGYGQGVSTIIGSWLGLVYNLQLPSHLEKEEYVACDNLQLTNRLILNNFFWEGPFGLNIIYSNYYNEESRYFRRPILSNPLDYYNPKVKNGTL